MKFAYASEKFSAARRCLMLPHPRGESESIAAAFHECSLCLHDLDLTELDENARLWVAKIRDLMDTTGVQDASGRGTWAIKADGLTENEKFELSRTIDELASWFEMHFWSER